MTRPARAAWPTPSRASSSGRWAARPRPGQRRARSHEHAARQTHAAAPARERAGVRAAHTTTPRRRPSAQPASRPPSWSRRRRTSRAGASARSAWPTARTRSTCSASRPAPTGRARSPRSRPPSTSTARPQKVTAKFRAYSSYDESFADYARLMKTSPRYAHGAWRTPTTRERLRARACSAPATPPTRPMPTSSGASSTPRCACSARMA